MISKSLKFCSHANCVSSGKKLKIEIDVLIIKRNIFSHNSTDSHAEFIFHEILHEVPRDQKASVKLQCSICKKFFRKQSLREHLRQHTQERIFDCPIESCPMSFTRKANLKNHVKNVHERSKSSPSSAPLFVCKFCGKKFTSK
jgi:hypothetical protein